MKARADRKAPPGASKTRQNTAPTAPFTRFVDDCSDSLRRIARATRGEHEFDEVVNHAWLLATDLAARGMTTDFLDTGFRTLLLGHLYQALVRYTDVHVRYANRLDTVQRAMKVDLRCASASLARNATILPAASSTTRTRASPRRWRPLRKEHLSWPGSNWSANAAMTCAASRIVY